MTHTEKEKRHCLAVCVCIILAALILRRLFLGYRDNDFYHIATSGRWIVTHGMMYQNPYFPLEGYDTVIQQWLYAVLLYAAYRAGGMPGVFLFTLLQACLLCFLAFWYLRIRKVERPAALTGALQFLLMMNQNNCRPEMISLCLLVAELICVEYYQQKRKAAVLCLLPVLTVAEANLHGAYAAFHLVFLLPYVISVYQLPVLKEVAGEIGIVKEDMSKKALILPAVLMAGTFFANPYGIRAVLVPVLSGRISMLNIMEQQPLTVHSRSIAYVLIGLILFAVAFWLKRLRGSTLWFGAGLFLLVLLAEKNEMLWAVAVLAVCGDLQCGVNCGRFWDIFLLPAKAAAPVISGSILLAAGIVTVNGAVLFRRTAEGGWEIKSKFSEEESDHEVFPADAIDYILSREPAPEKVSVMTSFNNGSAFLWKGIGSVYFEPKTEPYLRSINGRYDVVSEYTMLWECADAQQYQAFLENMILIISAARIT
ncbi:MAG: hypothetical protein IJ600_09650 [Lachnospiraceae bacterium]|nr:hypothetical protein [Lachnospiraceae bacterium]